MGEFIEQFGIDGWLLLAQTVNFSILLFVLWRFAYQPVLNMLEKRRKRVKKSIAQAEQIEKDRARTSKEFEATLLEAKAEAEAIVAKAKKTGEELKAQMQQEASEEHTRALAGRRGPD